MAEIIAHRLRVILAGRKRVCLDHFSVRRRLSPEDSHGEPPGLELELTKKHYFAEAISTTSSFDWFFANSVCRGLICIWLPEKLFRFHTWARKYWWP
jgi:hypothetical protein